VYLCWNPYLAVSPGVGFTVLAPSLASLLCPAVPKLCLAVSVEAEVWRWVAASVMSVRYFSMVVLGLDANRHAHQIRALNTRYVGDSRGGFRLMVLCLFVAYVGCPVRDFICPLLHMSGAGPTAFRR